MEQRRIAFLGHHAVRYRVSAGREHLSVASFAVEDVDQLAETVVYCADLDDLGEREIQMQQGMVHLWVHPSADDEEW